MYGNLDVTLEEHQSDELANVVTELEEEDLHNILMITMYGMYTVWEADLRKARLELFSNQQQNSTKSYNFIAIRGSRIWF